MHDGMCKICSKPTKWRNNKKGYAPTCGRTCGGVWIRQKLRNDPLKFEAFKSKMVEANRQRWASMSDQQRNELVDKIRTTVQHNLDTASPAERKRLLGYTDSLGRVTYQASPEQARVEQNLCALFDMEPMHG